VPLRQENTMCGDTVRAEPMGQLFGSCWPLRLSSTSKVR